MMNKFVRWQTNDLNLMLLSTVERWEGGTNKNVLDDKWELFWVKHETAHFQCSLMTINSSHFIWDKWDNWNFMSGLPLTMGAYTHNLLVSSRWYSCGLHRFHRDLYLHIEFLKMLTAILNEFMSSSMSPHCQKREIIRCDVRHMPESE